MGMASASREDYLKAVYNIQAEKNRAARAGEIAKSLRVSKPSVSEMVRKLEKDGLVEFRKNRGVSLSIKGVAEAAEAVRKHRLLEVFFHRILGIGKGFHKEADLVEHSISSEASEKLEAFLKHPKICPDGKVIPKGTRAVALDSAPLSSELKVLFSNLDSRELAQRLNALGLTPGARVRLVRRVRGGPVILLLKKGEIAIGREICSRIYVEVCGGMP